MNFTPIKKICYWSIAWGQHSKMLKTLVRSFREVGMKDDFICFSDIKIPHSISLPLSSDISLSTSNYLFKLGYLSKLKSFDYEYFIFLDADSFFVRNPDITPCSFLENSCPWFSFLEGPINSIETKRPEWWSVPNLVIEQNFRSLGVISKEIRNMNAGFWICKRDFILRAIYLMVECFKLFKNQNFKITEEIPMSYLTNYLYPDDSKFYIENYPKYWYSDWTGVFNNEIPKDIEWLATEYMTGRQLKINPAIVHAMRSDNALIHSIN
jgi:hypothetical protein